MEEEKKIGRPTDYTEALAERICDKISTSNISLRTLCKQEDMPHVTTILRWLREKESFRTQYARAKEEQADFLAEEMLEIADDGSNDTIHTEKGDIENKEWTNRSKLRVDTRKFIAAKLKPKKYGDKIDLTTNGENINAPVVIDWSGNYNPTNAKTD